MKKYAEDLAKDYELGEYPADYYQYIVDSLINGQRKQVRQLFNQMKAEDQANFLKNYLENEGYHKSCRNICIDELIK